MSVIRPRASGSSGCNGGLRKVARIDARLNVCKRRTTETRQVRYLLASIPNVGASPTVLPSVCLLIVALVATALKLAYAATAHDRPEVARSAATARRAWGSVPTIAGGDP